MGMKARILLGFTALVVAAATATSIQVPHATAAAGKPEAGAQQASAAVLNPTPSPNISDRVSTSWQTGDTVWALAYANGVVYVGGQFTTVRPSGDVAPTGNVTRTYLAAFSSTTGQLITSFNPDITGSAAAEVTALAVSPDQKTLYVGGIFDHVNGQYRDNVAAFSTATGALTGWAPTAFGKVLTIAPSPSGAEIYLGGAFNELDGAARTYAGAVTASGTGTIEPWAPAFDNVVTSIAVAPDNSRVIVGGYFNHVDGVLQNAIGSVSTTTGAHEGFAATIVPNNTVCQSSVKDVIIGGATTADPAGIAYVAAEGTGGGCFDGDFAAYVREPIPATGQTALPAGKLIWQNDCLGATQSIVLINGWLFKGSHAHDCAYSPGGFPQVPQGSGWVAHHLLDQSLTDGSVGHWNPSTSSPAEGLGPRVMATDGTRLFVGGDFDKVNGQDQQGFAIFGPLPDTVAPPTPAAPTAISTSKGVDSVTFPAVSTNDIGTLSYAIYRDSGTTPIATLTATSWPWALPVLHYRDAGLTPGATHTYRVTASNGTKTSAKSAASASVTVHGTNPAYSYLTTIKRDHPSFIWRLNQTSGSTAYDSTTHGYNGIYEPGTTKGAAGPITGVTGTATSFNGSTGLVTAKTKQTSPGTFSVETWFKTSTNLGGLIAGFGSGQTGPSATYDRHVYMMNDGQLVFGIWNGSGPDTIETSNVYNDNKWHYVIGTYQASTKTMVLWVDGQKIGTHTATATSYSGYWRVGYDNLTGWNLDYWGHNSQGTTEPLRYHFNGTVGYVAVYPTALSAARVAAHYAANSQSH